MNILLNISHPAHVHFFKNFIEIMQQRGHSIFVFARNKDISFRLLKAYKIKYQVLGKHHKTIGGKIVASLSHMAKLLFYAKKYKIDIFLDSGPFYLAPVSFFVRKPYIIANNTDVNFALEFSKNFKTYYLHNMSFKRKMGPRQIKIDSINELAFLHPKYFVPDDSILGKLGINKNDKIILLRFVSWNSLDDIGKCGFTIQEIRKLVAEFKQYGKVFISSEYDLPDDLDKHRLETYHRLPFGKMQDIEAHASLFFGESGAMASECAMLGVPAFYVSPKSLGFTAELDKKYGLLFDFRDKKEAFDKAIEILNKNDFLADFQIKREKLLKEKISYTDFLVWYVENFPESYDIMKKNPNYQYNFSSR